MSTATIETLDSVVTKKTLAWEGDDLSLDDVLVRLSDAEKEEPPKEPEPLPSLNGKLKVEILGKSMAMKDIGVSQWFAGFVNSLIVRGIASGYKDRRGNLTGEFKPGNNVTYAEIAKMALKAAQISTRNASVPKNHYAKNDWSAKYVATLELRNVSTFANARLNVTHPASRGAVVQTILEVFDVPIKNEVIGKVYSDVARGTRHAAAIELATFDGLVSGDDGKTTFRPNAPINRAEVAKIIINAIEIYGGETED